MFPFFKKGRNRGTKNDVFHEELPQQTADLIIVTEEIFSEKLYCL